MLPPDASSSSDAQPSRSLVQRMLRETSRFAMLQVVGSVLAWGAHIALARLLERRDFGVFAICSFYIGLGSLLGNGGLAATLIRRRGDVSREEYQSALTAILVVTALLAAVLFFGADWIGRRNQFSPSETLVVRAMAPLYFLGALRLVPYVRLERELRFSAIARIELVAGLLRHGVALGFAFAFGSVWALVCSHLVGSVMQVVLAYAASPGWVGLGWSWRVFRPLFAYGSKVQLLTVFAYFKDNISRAALGVAVGPAAVGVFDFAVSYIQIPVVAVNSLARVQLPVYARFQASDPMLHTTLRASMRTALLVGVPLLLMLAVAGPEVIPLIYGEKWLPAVPVAWALLLNMICGLVDSPLFTFLQAQGRAGLALVAFGAWTASTWALALVVVFVAPERLALLGGAYSAATLAVTAWLLRWVSRYLGRPATAGLEAPVLAGLGALLVAGLFWWRAGAWCTPIIVSGVVLVAYLACLYAIEGRVLFAEIRSIAANARRAPAKPVPEGVEQ